MAKRKVLNGVGKRVTYIVDPQLDNLLEIYCNHLGLMKNAVVNDMLTQYLSAHTQEIKRELARLQAAWDRMFTDVSTEPEPKR